MGDLLAKLHTLLQGEPLRAVGYAVGLGLYVAGRVSGAIEDLPLDQALLQGGAYATGFVTFIETLRRLVYSPATVQAIIGSNATPAAADGDTA